MKTIIEQCGQIFELGDLNFRCVLKKGHKARNHRANLSVDYVGQSPLSERLRVLQVQYIREEEQEEVSLP